MSLISFRSATVACKLFRPTEVDSCHQVMKPCNFTTILPNSTLPNNSDYKLPWKQVEFFVSELDFKLMTTKNVTLQNTVLSVLLSDAGCNDWENLAVSQPLGGAMQAGGYTGLYICRHQCILFTQEGTHSCNHSDHAYFHPFR